MDIAHYSSISWLTRVVRRPGLWLILALLVLVTFLHYAETLKHPAFLTQITAYLGLQRHAFERILYLAPIVWAGFLFGCKGGLATSLVSLACMLPRVFFISQYTVDALFESSVVFIIGNALNISYASLRKERVYRTQLEVAHQELLKSEESYRQLFENTVDAIWLHDLDGNITAVNKAAENLTGYSMEELMKMNVTDFLSEESLELARQIRHKLMANEPMEQPYEQHLVRKDKSHVHVQLATSLVFEKDEIVAFQHVARDVTEQKRMQENLRFYLEQATRAQEEERKRISRELHDDTVQALVVHSRRLDALISGGKGLSEENRVRLDELRQESNNIMESIRRLSRDLRPAALDRLGLLPALEWLASDVAGYSGMATTVNTSGVSRRLPEEVELLLFRIVQEALRNVWRHAEATQADVLVEFAEEKIKLTVSDNGKGFSFSGSISDLVREGKLGLAGIQERAQLIGGVVTVQSEPDKGSSIMVEVPL